MTTPTDPRDDQARIPLQGGPAPFGVVTTDSPASPQRRFLRWPWIAAAVVVVLALAGGITYALMPSSEDKAVEQCQAAITGKLKSPSTAQYADPVVSSEDGKFGTYYDVSGTVDAQNGFGAMVRGEYLCKVSRESGGSWLVTTSTLTQP